MKKIAYRRNAGSTYNINYHLVWCPKYRRKVLVSPIDDRLKEFLHEKATELGLQIKSLEVMVDHLHCFITGDPTRPLQFILNQLKGYTAKKLREEFPQLKSKLPCMWSRSYFAESIGNISEKTVEKYIANQKNV